MPPPGDTSTARLQVDIRDPVWDYVYTPLTHAVTVISSRFNYLQFLTIRLYLSLVFGALVLLLLRLALWR